MVEKLRKQYIGGRDYLFNRLWVIIILHWWLEENNVIMNTKKKILFISYDGMTDPLGPKPGDSLFGRTYKIWLSVYHFKL